MITFAWYLLKVTICSGILFGYYYIALRNKAFHRWNRFYLLATIVISLIVPVMKINIFSFGEQKGTVVQILQTISYGDEAVIEYSRNSSFQLTTENVTVATYLLVCAAFLFVFFLSLIKIKRLKKKYPATKFDDISFINTNAKGTPFSFFKSIFWNNAIELNSKPGQQIFNHEIAHVKEKHSYDKVFMNIVLIFFWINPFFWLIRKELYMIHEFIADKDALEDSDINSFAEMVLQTVYPGQSFSLTNNFFYSPLKRRLLMLSKNKNPKVNYVSRLLVLPLTALVFFAFTLKVKTVNKINYTEAKPILGEMILKNIGLPESMPRGMDTTFPMNYNYNGKKVRSMEVQSKSKNIKVTEPVTKVTYEDGTSEMISKQEADKRGIVSPPSPAHLPPNAPVPPPPPPSATSVTFPLINDKVDIAYSNGHTESITKKEAEKQGILSRITQNTPLDTIPDKVFTKVENEAEFPGGHEAWLKYIIRQIIKAQEKFTEKDFGTCLVKFIVNTDGSVSNVEATTMKGSQLAKTAVEAVRKGPKWIPATQNGHTVAAYRLQPVTLSNPEKNAPSTNSQKSNQSGRVNTSNEPKAIFTKLEQPASFPGGNSAWLKYITRAIQKNGNELIADKYSLGVCRVRFTVSKDGKISDVEAVDKQGSKLADVSVNAIKQGPKWIPGEQNGHAVNSLVIQPVRFFLNDNNNSRIITEPR
ncbi:MAG: energy transducer TonB [Bacteroidota bacterium]|nr:energy transducer TonB [Bacteroidota bacterium]